MSTLSITRSFYSSAIFFTGLYTILTFSRSIIYFQLGAQVAALSSIVGWLVFEFLVWLIWSLVLLKYYHHKRFGFTCWAMIVYLAASLYYFVLWYELTKTSEFTTHYIIASVVFIGAGILYAVSLIFSKAGKRPWLKAVGILSSILGLIGLSTFILTFSDNDVLLNGTAARIEQWVTLVGSLVPVLFIMNFWSERATAEKAYTSRQKSLTTYMDLVATIFFGQKIASEALWLSNHPDHVPESVPDLSCLLRPSPFPEVVILPWPKILWMYPYGLSMERKIETCR